MSTPFARYFARPRQWYKPARHVEVDRFGWILREVYESGKVVYEWDGKLDANARLLSEGDYVTLIKQPIEAN